MASALDSVCIKTTEMHTGGEPLRIVESGYPAIKGGTILDKRRYVKDHLDHLRQFLMFEPRGHHDMYGALLVEPDIEEADLAVLFMHNEGYSTMCGHAVIALGRYAMDKGLAKKKQSDARSTEEVSVNIQCPCGLVRAYVSMTAGLPGSVRFHSVPAFAFALDVAVNVAGHGRVVVDIGYGGAFYALVSAHQVGLDVSTSSTAELKNAGASISEAVRSAVTIRHPDDPDLGFLYGTILTDGQDSFCDDPTLNLCVFADSEVDRSPTGSGVTARVAVQYRRGLIALGQKRTFQNGVTGSKFKGHAVSECRCGDMPAVVVEVSGEAFYSGTSTFTAEKNDHLAGGFLMR